MGKFNPEDLLAVQSLLCHKQDDWATLRFCTTNNTEGPGSIQQCDTSPWKALLNVSLGRARPGGSIRNWTRRPPKDKSGWGYLRPGDRIMSDCSTAHDFGKSGRPGMSGIIRS